MTDAELLIPMTEPTTETAKPAMKWYIVHTYSGYEHKAKAALEERVRSLIFVQMVLDDDTWHVIKDTPKITGFVGHSTNPPEVPISEVAEIEQQMEEGALRPKPKVLFEVGEAIKVVDGPFQDFNGTVEEVKPEKGKVRVLISIFGRATPVELDFVQVEKA